MLERRRYAIRRPPGTSPPFTHPLDASARIAYAARIALSPPEAVARPPDGAPDTPLLAIALLPCLPLLLGVGIMLAGGAPPGRWGVQLVGAALGAAALRVLVRRPELSRRAAAAIVVLCGVLLAATLLDTGIDGVRRWLVWGPARLHPSALLAPLLLVAMARWNAAHPARAHALGCGVQAIHLLQPDAGQATAFGVAALTLVARTPLAPRVRGFLAVGYAGSIAATWARPDPLRPAPFVEDIVAHAFGLGEATGWLALASLGVAALTPMMTVRRAPAEAAARAAATALTVYLAGTMLVVRFGEFPVPLLGFGPSPVLGFFLGLGALCRLSSHGGASGDRRRHDPWLRMLTSAGASDRVERCLRSQTICADGAAPEDRSNGQP